MFCPVCKSEYREGFTECSDCGAALVNHLANRSDRTNFEELEILWAGQDARAKGEICDRLDAKSIHYEDDAVEGKLMPAFPQSIYRIQVRKRDRAAALQAIQNVSLTDADSYLRKSPGFILDRNSDLLNKISSLNRSSSEQALVSERTFQNKNLKELTDSHESHRSQETVLDDQLENFSPDNATSQVWSGADGAMAQNINVCLREVGIGCVVNETQGNFNVCVEGTSEIRAKEIIREIVEQTPPE